MTISCTCPKCGRVCGFKDQYAGHRARCLSCDARFIIPEPGADAAIVPDAEPVRPEAEEPLPGFYTAVWQETLHSLFQRESVPGIIIMITLTCFHFFIGDKDYSINLPGFRLPLFVGWVVTAITAGYLLWYFMEIINETAFGEDILPDIFSGGGFSFIGQGAKSIYFFFATFGVALIPAFLLINGLNFIGIAWPPLEITIVAVCLCIVPLLLAILACEIAPWMLLRFDRLVVIIAKTFWPYMFTTIITLTAFLMIFITVGYFATGDRNAPPAALMLTGRLIAVFIAVFAMRTIGLYARHYFPMFPDLKIPEY